MDKEDRIGLAPFGIRHSGEGAKGKGYFGELPSKDGMVSTEISTESDIGEHPLLVPTLTRKEIQHLLGHKINNGDCIHCDRHVNENKK